MNGLIKRWNDECCQVFFNLCDLICCFNLICSVLIMINKDVTESKDDTKGALLWVAGKGMIIFENLKI